MKTLILLAIGSGLAWAQTAAPKAAAAPKTGGTPKATAGSKTGAAKKGTGASSSARLLNPAAWNKQAPPEFKAKFTTTKGDIVMDIHRDWAPGGADRFYNLIKSGFFTNVSFYRVVPNFVVQFGAAPDPKVEAAWNRASIKDDPVKQSNKKYSLTFAAGGPNTRTTEIFISLKDNAMLDGMGFAPFGEVVEGQAVVDQIYSGYGDMAEQGGQGPSQMQLQKEGKAYLDKNFPKLDSIQSATVVSGEPAPAPKAAPKAAPKSAAPGVKKTLPIQKKPDAK
jgi:peptidyl-prolyl cis-trans isomerase A (cyclophilin A)